MSAERCAVCEGPLVTFLSLAQDPQSGEVFSVLQCTRCGLGHTMPRPHDMAPYYEIAYFGGRHGASEKLCMARRIRFVKALASGGRLLDFGCGDGSFLIAAANAGFDVTGVDIEIAHARTKGLEVVECLDEVRGSFDVITLWHSLEHVPNPINTMRRLVSLLSKNGAVVAGVPNFASLQARCFGARWFHLDVPRHLYHFSHQSLGTLFTEVGLEPVKSWGTEGEIDLFGWTQSVLNGLFPSQPNVLFDVITHRQKSHRRLMVYTSLIFGAIISLITAPIVPIASYFDRGAVLVLGGRKL